VDTKTSLLDVNIQFSLIIHHFHFQYPSFTHSSRTASVFWSSPSCKHCTTRVTSPSRWTTSTTYPIVLESHLYPKSHRQALLKQTHSCQPQQHLLPPQPKKTWQTTTVSSSAARSQVSYHPIKYTHTN